MALNRVVGTGLVLGLAACTSIRAVPPKNLVAKQLPDVVSVTYPDKTVLVVMGPEVSADTLRGLRWGTQDSVVIPLDSLQTIQAKVPDHAKTALLATTLGLAVATTVYVVFSKTGKQNDSLDVCFGDEAMKHPDQYPQCGSN
ncbi:MAG TPA: hypothetical protein VMK12_28680 [Anaeromyxobacteraceae bacterium]|nr:hypothetical protein [Anaeromyxobacteraceae bacterium]